jgi:predicted Zn-dependent protease
MSRFVLRSIVCALAFALTAPAAPSARAQSNELPSLGDAAGDDLSPVNERKWGEAIMRQVVRDKDYLPDPDTADYLNWLGYRLVAASPARHMDFNFFAVRDPMLNAFALPGGFIGVHSGLVLSAQNESELAAVLGHEIGHVEQRHIARMIAKQRESAAVAIGALLLAILAARSGSSSAGPATEAAIAVGQASALQQQLNFSREAEREADRIGFQILVDAGFDPTAMGAFFGRLQQGSRLYETAAPAYLRTHPLTVERIGDIQTRVGEARRRQRADSVEFHLVRARLRVLQDESAQGLRESRATFQGQLRNRTAPSEAAAYYGLGLAQLRLNEPAAALDAATKARQLARGASPMLDKLYSAAKFYAARNNEARDEAIKLAQEATGRYPISRLTALHYIDLLQQTKRDADAVAFLREQLALPRSDPKYYELLARSYTALNRRTLQHQATAEAYALLGALPAAVEQLQLARKAADADFYVMSEVDARLRQLNQQLQEQREEAIRSGRRSEEGKGK